MNFYVRTSGRQIEIVFWDAEVCRAIPISKALAVQKAYELLKAVQETEEPKK